MKLFLSVLLFSICGFSQGLPTDQIQGRWNAKHPIYAKDASLFISFHFSKDHMKLSGTCVYDDQTQLQVSVSVKVAYVANDIYIQQSQQSEITDGYKFCRVALTHTKWQFYFNGTGQAVLIAAVPYGMQFQLVRR